MDSKKSAPNTHKSLGWIMVIGIIIVAAGLRAPLTSVGPLIGLMREDIYISNTWAGMLTTLPLLAFGLFSLLYLSWREDLVRKQLFLWRSFFLL